MQAQAEAELGRRPDGLALKGLGLTVRCATGNSEAGIRG